MSQRIVESDILQALYILSPVGRRWLANHFEQKFGKINYESLETTLNTLVGRGAVIVKSVDGVTLWGLPGTWT